MSPNQQDRRESRTSRQREIERYDSGRNTVVSGFEQAPLLALAGGVAVGALLAAIIPASRRERELLSPVADRIKDRATDAIDAAKDAGQARLDELGLTRDKGTETLRSILEGAGDAARASADAAVTAIRGQRD